MDAPAPGANPIQTTNINAFRLLLNILKWTPFQYFLLCFLTYRYHDILQETFSDLEKQDHWMTTFQALLLFKYLKVIVHTIAFLTYKPFPIPETPTIKPEDVTVVIPTVGTIDDPEFRETLQTIFANHPNKIYVCTVGQEKYDTAERVCKEEYNKLSPEDRALTGMELMAIEQASKRKQIFAVLLGVETEIVALADDHVFWGPKYLAASIAPFEDPRIGAVGTNKRVRRDNFEFTWPNFLNFIACLYLERHNFECTASCNVDQSVFVLSGRTAFYRSKMLQHPSFAQKYLRETWFYGLVGGGGFAVDDDNLLTRFTIGVGKHRLWFQNSQDTIMATTLGDPAKFFKQMDRWIRTTWRSNSTSIFSDQTPWGTQPWSVYAIYLSSFVNFALFYDFALFYTLGRSDINIPLMYREFNKDSYFFVKRKHAMYALGLLLFLSKMIKPFPHFVRNPKDMIWIPGYMLFGWYHSIIKLKALLTVYVVAWGTRPGVK